VPEHDEWIKTSSVRRSGTRDLKQSDETNSRPAPTKRKGPHAGSWNSNEKGTCGERLICVVGSVETSSERIARRALRQRKGSASSAKREKKNSWPCGACGAGRGTVDKEGRTIADVANAGVTEGGDQPMQNGM